LKRNGDDASKAAAWPGTAGALGILAAAPRGLTESTMLALGFTSELLASLVRDGLATVVSETLRAGDPTNKEKRIKITDAGLRALEG
jgi:hypothetical protein